MRNKFAVVCSRKLFCKLSQVYMFIDSAISITSTGLIKDVESDKALETARETYRNLLKLEFDDVTEEEVIKLNDFKYSHHFKLMSKEDAVDTIDFVDYINGSCANRNIIIHCDAGAFRSVAIGKILERHLNYKVTYLNTDNPEVNNTHVFNMLEKEFNARKLYK